MSLSNDVLFQEIVKLEPLERMKVSARSAIKYGSVIGATAIVSGILGGPLGLAAGGAVSSCIAGYMSRNKFQSVPHILCYETTPEQREKLTKEVYKLLRSKHISTIRDFIFSLNNNTELVEAIIQILVMFLTSEMGLSVKI